MDYKGKYIDAHVHITPVTELGKINNKFQTQLLNYGYKKMGSGGFYIMPPFIHDSQFTEDTLIAVMDAYHVERSIILQSLMVPINEEVATAVRKYPDRLSGAMVVEPKDGFEAEMEKWCACGLKVIKFEMRAQSDPAMFPNICYDSEIMMRMFEKAEQLGLTVTIDPGPVNFPVYKPEALEKAVKAFPDLHFVLCHLGYPKPLTSKEFRDKWMQMVSVTAYENCWVDCSAMPDFFDEEGWPYPSALEIFKQVRDIAGIDSILWGTDITGTLNRATYPQMQDMYSRAGFLSEKDLNKLFYQNSINAYKL